MKVKTLAVAMVGSGGDGVVTSGDMVLNAVAEEGLYAIAGKSFGPQIRGGESSMRVRVSTTPVDNTGSGLDYLIVLNWRDYHRFSGELNMAENGVIFCEADPKVAMEGVPPGIKAKEVVPVEFQKLADAAGAKRAKNVLTIGILSALANIRKERFLSSLDKKFTKKGPEVLEMNRNAYNAGYSLAKSLRKETWPELEYAPSAPKMITDANYAVAAAAAAAGLQVFAGYPITPSTEVMQWLAVNLPRFGGTVVQAEDEIAAMAMVCGASFAGAKAMTTTSGPGMSLKAELIGMASIAELPLVIVNVQRGGPSTGLPTKGEQADLNQALYSAHGDAPRPVLAAYDVLSAVRLTFEAFNLAETYQTPVVLLTDAFMALGKQVCELPDLANKKLYPVSYRKVPTAEELKAGYSRYKRYADGISPMSIPGTEGGSYLASGIEHDEVGRPISDATLHHVMNAKRIEKLQPIRKRADLVLTFGDADAKDALIAWGGSVGPAREAMEILKAQGKKTKLLVPLLVAPLPTESFKAFLKGVERLGVIELNYQGQLAAYLRTELDLPKATHAIHRSGGAVWQPQELVGRIKETVLAN
ncbi:MAG: 2-oxoacid:acceptor oxidoreductase subunit alpha [Deltaproteobacteria bacterium]|nr:2-oxoacid:acceptor oxidoreductase subunit alpha [Deltaproteobacteria bacterium]